MPVNFLQTDLLLEETRQYLGLQSENDFEDKNQSTCSNSNSSRSRKGRGRGTRTGTGTSSERNPPSILIDPLEDLSSSVSKLKINSDSNLQKRSSSRISSTADVHLELQEHCSSSRSSSRSSSKIELLQEDSISSTQASSRIGVDSELEEHRSSCGSRRGSKTNDHSNLQENSSRNVNLDSNLRKPNLQLRNLVSDLEDFLSGQPSTSVSGVEYSSLSKQLALCYLSLGEEAKAVLHLVESHSVFLRQQVLHRHLKSSLQKLYSAEEAQAPVFGLRPSDLDLQLGREQKVLRSVLEELPEEWYVIQVTKQYEDSSAPSPADASTHPMHVTVLPTGKRTIDGAAKTAPICVTLPKPKTQMHYDIVDEIKKLLRSNKSDLEAHYERKDLYWKMRERQNTKLQTAVLGLENFWLREWRILFMSDPTDDRHPVAVEVRNLVEKLLSDDPSSRTSGEFLETDRRSRTKWLLCKIAMGSYHLRKQELERAVHQVLGGNGKLARNFIASIHGLSKKISTLASAKRKTLVLILDETMDYIPFEAMEILQEQPVTRLPSLHITYDLFKEHQASIVGGCKVIRRREDPLGTFIVNPARNLPKMEKRMRLFIDYWLPDWSGLYNVEPEAKEFIKALVDYNILIYAGHGNGIQYLSASNIEKLKVKAVVLLFGCSSVKLLPIGGRFPPYGISYQYLKASSPCVLGMLWEVTDRDIDKMTASFLSSWIPSKAERPWTDVDLDAWCLGNLRFKKSNSTSEPIEPEMLRAVARSKKTCTQYMTSSAIVIRGLPIRLEDDDSGRSG